MHLPEKGRPDLPGTRGGIHGCGNLGEEHNRRACRADQHNPPPDTPRRSSARASSTCATSWCRCATASISASTSTGRISVASFRRCSRSRRITRNTRLRNSPKPCNGRSRPGRACGSAAPRAAIPIFWCAAAMCMSAAIFAAPASPTAAARRNGTCTI